MVYLMAERSLRKFEIAKAGNTITPYFLSCLSL